MFSSKTSVSGIWSTTHFCTRPPRCPFLLGTRLNAHRIKSVRRISVVSGRERCVVHAASVVEKGGGQGSQSEAEEKLPRKSKKSKKAVDEGQRLSKVMAGAGVASRRACEEIIFAGRVTVNEEIVMVPQTKVDLKKDMVVVDGKKLTAIPHKKFYFAVNKPKGYLCTSKPSDFEGKNKKIVLDIFDDWIKEWKKDKPKGVTPPRLFTVGRLDVNSWGLIFVTNDGEWAQRITHPSFDFTKEYLVKLDKIPTKLELKKIAAGCFVDGRKVVPAAVFDEGQHVRIVVTEGRNREVREIVGNAGLEVKSLKRLRIGGYRMPQALKVGEFRELKPHEWKRVLNKGAQYLV